MFVPSSASSGMAGDRLEQEETRQRVNQALAGLPEIEREVVLLRCQGDLSFDEAATALGIPVGTAATRYRSAIAKLRMRLSHD